MKSKQQINKEAQGYIEKPVQHICSNCANMKTETTYPDPKYPNYVKEYNSCLIGGFSVKKLATCSMFKSKP